MPLYKRKPFSLAETPQSLEPHELVFQVRFTKEIFKDYREYLNRINLYRQRVWTCKMTGKTNLTYEEALVSEQLATEKVQQFPKELVAPILHTVQFSTLQLLDLINNICKKLQERWLEGDQLYGRKEQSVCPCKILKVLEDGDTVSYEVGWINKDKDVTDTSVIKVEDLIRKKLPFTREVLKSFIRESTSRSCPWVVHEKLAKQYGISTKIPEELQEKISSQGQPHGSNKMKKRKNTPTEDSESLVATKKAKKEEDKPPAESVKYPVDDLLVKPGADDPVFTDRPSPSREFTVPVDCVGDLLMVWDFCSSFSRMLQLWPFSLEDFQNAICHKGNNLILIVESHSAILRLLIEEEQEYYTAIQNKNRNGKITILNWTSFLCDFLEMQDLPELSSCVATIKRGHYGLLDIRAKLGILRELVSQAIVTNAFREQLDEIIEQRQALAATKREEALEEGRKRREEKELQKAAAGNMTNGHILENGGGNLQVPENGYENGHVPEERGDDASKSSRKNISGNRKSKSVNMAAETKQKIGVKESSCAEEDKDGVDEANGKKNKEQRKVYLERELEKRLVRTNPLGKDRNYNRYWFFSRDGRIFVESPDSKLWGYYSSKEEFDALMGSLNPKGEREKALQTQLNRSYNRICLGLQKRSKYVAHKIAMEEAVLRRSTRVRAPRDNPAMEFLNYVNKWKTK